MKLMQILGKYDTALLDQIAADKVDETVTLRLPQPIIVQEIISALGSQSYISNKILYGKPPVYAILNLILQTPESVIAAEGFFKKVLETVKTFSIRAGQHQNLHDKNYTLYIKILRKAWENDSIIDKSEAHILEVVKQELQIWDREHFILMHDSSILSLWDIEREFYIARNELLATGILLGYDDKYAIADEVAIQIRKTFGIEIMDDSYKRLLNSLTKEDLALVLQSHTLNVSGSKEAMAERIIDSLIPPFDVLGFVHLESLRELCRREAIQVSGAKNIVVSNIIQHFDKDQDLQTEEVDEPVATKPLTPEVREMDAEIYPKLLFNLTGQQLYDILFQASMMTSGAKEERVKRITDSNWSERSIFNFLRKEDLAQLCRRLSFPVSGSKQELVDRLLDYTPTPVPVIEPVSEKQTLVSSAIEMELKPKVITSDLPEASEVTSLPVAYEQLGTEFSDLQHDERVVLAVLKEAKSITENDLVRIIARYKLGWFLHKAHMAELIAKLNRGNKRYIQIKSVQNSNVYQWTGSEKPDEQVVEKKSARDIIDALRHGVVPKTNLDLLMVGQQTARKHLSEILLELNVHKSHFKFIRGQYGSGKTFLCSWLKEFALEHEFAVSFMNISHDQPLSDLPIFFSGMINGLRTPEKQDSCALVDILESWLLNIHNRTAKIEGVDTTKLGVTTNLAKAVERSIEMELANLNDIEPGFAQALRAFYEGKFEEDIELSSNAVAWINGSRSLSSQSLRDIGVKGYLEANNVFPRMRAILEIINGARYKGLLLLVDELELIRKFPHARQREQALETLRLLIDEAGRNALPGCLVIFTGTDEFFEDQRYGLRSYEALAERVMTPLTHENFVSMRQPIIILESLDRERLTQVISKIRDLYAIAYSCTAKEFADDESITKLIEEWTIFGEESIDRKPRPILREFIQMLDLCEENKGVSLSQFLKKSKIETIPAPSYN